MVSNLCKSIARGIHVLTRSLHVLQKYGCEEVVQLWTAMHGFLACIRTYSRHDNLTSPADSKGSLCISGAICWVRPVSESHIGLSLASVLEVAQLARPLFWTRYIDKFIWVAV